VRRTVWTYALAAVTLGSLIAMYVVAFIIGAEPLPLAIVVIAIILATIGALVAVRDSLRVPRPRMADAAASVCTAVIIGMMVAPRGPLDVRSECSAYTGAFVGLLAPAVAVPFGWVLLAGGLAGLLWSVIGPYVLPGVGGRLGLVALMGSSFVYWLASRRWGTSTKPSCCPRCRAWRIWP